MALTVWEDCSHLEVAGGQPDDGGFVQLGGDGRGQGQQLGQLIELPILLLPAGLSCVLRLLLHNDDDDDNEGDGDQCRIR